MDSVAELIREIYRQARVQKMPPPGATRLVKLLYLADLEWRRNHSGQPLSTLEWYFHDFGPYANELMEFTNGPDAEAVELTGGRVLKRPTWDPGELERSHLSEEVSGLLSRLVKEWGDADLFSLLNHVYFETEPMEAPVRGQNLDFSNVKPRMSLAIHLDPKRLAELRRELRARTKELRLTRDGVHEPALELEQASAWDEPPAALPAGATVTIT